VDPVLPRELSGPVCDSYGSLGVRDLAPGHEPKVADPWMLRAPAAPAASSPPPGVRVFSAESDDDVVTFEHVAFMAAGGTPPDRPGELHPPGSQHVRGLRLLIATLDDVPSGTALTVEHDRGLVISAVAVLPGVRGRGIGAALVASALAVAPDRPATLAASDQGLGLYRRLGFREVTRPRHWWCPTEPEAAR
jgi:GNAT superfamily N-acetyltransferase